MRITTLATTYLATLALWGCGAATGADDAPATPETSAYTPVPITADDQPGSARQVRCQVGSAAEATCTFTPLFGDESLQLDGPDIALRLVVIDGEGTLFEVFGPERRVGIGGTYHRDPRDRGCWIANADSSAPSRICAR